MDLPDELIQLYSLAHSSFGFALGDSAIPLPKSGLYPEMWFLAVIRFSIWLLYYIFKGKAYVEYTIFNVSFLT